MEMVHKSISSSCRRSPGWFKRATIEGTNDLSSHFVLMGLLPDGNSWNDKVIRLVLALRSWSCNTDQTFICGDNKVR